MKGSSVTASSLSPPAQRQAVSGNHLAVSIVRPSRSAPAPAANVASTGHSPSAAGGIASSSSIVGVTSSTPPLAAAADADLSPPSSPGTSRPPSPSHHSSESGSDDVGDEEAPVPVTYVSVELTDLKLCQRFVLTAGVRPPIPIGCPESISQLLRNCWDENPDDRPSFEIIVEYLDLHQKEFEALDLPLALPGESNYVAENASYYA
jgi:hypothetical protein